MLRQTNRFLGAILLISGTTIGAGMLAVPMTTGLAGFIPSVLVMIAIWLFMMLSAYYLLEVNLRMRGESNLISMMGKTLHGPGQAISWVVYLLLLYSLMSAYMVGCSNVFHALIPMPPVVWPLLVFLFFASFIYFGTLVVDYLNRILMAALVVTFLLVLSFGCCHIDLNNLKTVDVSYLLPSISILLTTFGYHIIIPTLTTYLDHDTRLLKRAIFIGSFVPLLIYIIWQFFVMGILPVERLREAAEGGALLSGRMIQIFSLFAMITSLLGVSLSLSDFLADGLKIKKTSLGKVWVVLLAFVPPLFFTLFYPNGFILALKFAGIFVVILLALLPALMAWFERYGSEKTFLKSEFKVFGGKALMILTIVLSLALLAVELFA